MLGTPACPSFWLGPEFPLRIARLSLRRANEGGCIDIEGGVPPVYKKKEMKWKERNKERKKERKRKKEKERKKEQVLHPLPWASLL